MDVISLWDNSRDNVCNYTTQQRHVTALDQSQHGFFVKVSWRLCLHTIYVHTKCVNYIEFNHINMSIHKWYTVINDI